MSKMGNSVEIFLKFRDECFKIFLQKVTEIIILLQSFPKIVNSDGNIPEYPLENSEEYS